MAAKSLTVGFGEADITPPKERTVALAGQYYSRVAEGIHSPLKVVVLLLEQNNHHSLMISFDVVNLAVGFCNEIKERTADHFNCLSPDKITINTIHTHSAPLVSPPKDWMETVPDAISFQEYRGLLIEKTLEAASRAFREKQVAGLAHNLQHAAVGHCRRAVYSDGTAEMYGDTGREDFVGMEGGGDAGVELMYFYDKNQQPFGAIVNAACPSQVMEATRVISSDYMGTLREKLKSRYGENFRTLCQISAAGCQSPRDLVRHYKGGLDFWSEAGVEVVSDRLLAAVEKGGEEGNKCINYDPVFRHNSPKISLPRRRVSYSEFVGAEKELKRLVNIQDEETAYADFCSHLLRNENMPDNPGPYDSKLHHFVKIKSHQAAIKRYKDQDARPFVDIDFHCIRVGEAVLVTNPFELFLEYGHRIKARSSAPQTFVIQLSNGSYGYLPTKNAEEHGGYGGQVINGQIGSDGGAKLVDETVSAIYNVFQSD